MVHGAAASLLRVVCCAVTLSAGGGMIPFHEVVFSSKEDGWSPEEINTIFRHALC